MFRRDVGAAVLLLVILFFSVAIAKAQEGVILKEGMEGDAISQWAGNSCDMSRETGNVHSGRGSLKIVDRGGNSQVYKVLTTQIGKFYQVIGWGYRLSTNKGGWKGNIAVSSKGGKVSSDGYLSSSEFITEAEKWKKLELIFTAEERETYLILTSQNGTGDVTYFDDIEVKEIEKAQAEKLIKEISGEKESYSEQIQVVKLAGSPKQIGEMWGKINKDAIIDDFNKYFLKRAKDNNISPEMLIDRSKRFVEIAQKIAPHWLEEAEAIANTAGLDKELYISFIANVYRGLFLQDECTSYSVSKKFTEGNAVFFHKNRDNVEKKQSVFILSNNIEDINKFIAVSDASVISCMMMVNEKGLAGSADTGGDVGTPKFRGIMNTFLLRHIAERASTCKEALEIIQDFVKKGYYAGGGRVGTHWLFVDREGSILEVNNNADTVSFKYHEEKVYFSARKNSKAAKILTHVEKPIDFHRFHNVSRNPSICLCSTIAGMTVEISKKHPGYLTCVWVSFPAKSLSFPLFMGGENTPIPLLNGELYTVAKDINCSRSILENLEESSYFNKQLLEDKVNILLKRGRTRKVANLLDLWVQKYVKAYLALLKAWPSSDIRSN